MAIHVQDFQSVEASRETVVLSIHGSASINSFKELVQRGANLWPDAPAEIKEFADLVTTGQVLQDYKAQDLKRKTINSGEIT
jgi:hypothetical protein